MRGTHAQNATCAQPKSQPQLAADDSELKEVNGMAK